MLSRKPDLIVPVRDRRRRRRILTLKHFGIAAAVLVVLFIAISIRSEWRGRSLTGEDYGRLYGREVPEAASIERKPIETVTEGTVLDQNSADPFLVEAAAREQILGVTPQDIAAMQASAVSSTTTPIVVGQQATMRSEKGSVAIVGGSEGVAIVKTTTNDLPKLGGGFGQ